MDLTLESGESRGEHILPKGERAESRVLEDEEGEEEEEEGRAEMEDVAVEFQTDGQPPGPVRDPDEIGLESTTDNPTPSNFQPSTLNQSRDRHLLPLRPQILKPEP
jgi:hypothetical protein